MAESRVRIGGSGWTVFTWRGQRLAWLESISDQAPRAVAQPRAIQPIDAEVPLEIVTPRAVGAGTLQLRVFELWNKPVWQTLYGLEGSGTLLDVFKRQVELGDISCQKIIKLPSGGTRVKNYYGCTIIDIDEAETVNIGTMELPKQITMMYTHARWL